MVVSNTFPPAFYIFLTGRGLFSIIDSIIGTAVAWHLYQKTGDPFDLALVGLFQIAPVYIFFVFTGWVADHVSRKRVLQFGALAQGLILITLALQMQDGAFNKWALFALLAAMGSVKAFLSPSLQAIVPNLVPPQQLGAAVAVTSTVWNLALTAGPFLAGLMIAAFDYSTYWSVAALALIISVCFLFLPAIPAANIGQSRSGKALWQGFHFLSNNRIVLGSLVMDVLIVMGGSVVALLPIYASDILAIGPQGLGLLRSMPAIGAVIIGIYLSKYKTDFRYAGRTLFIALFIFSLSIIGFAIATSVWVACACLILYGGSDMFSVVIRGAAIQHNTPDSLRGRVGALNSLFIASSNQLGDFRGGTVAALTGPVNAALIGGITSLVIVGWGLRTFPSLRKMTSTKMTHQ